MAQNAFSQCINKTNEKKDKYCKHTTANGGVGELHKLKNFLTVQNDFVLVFDHLRNMNAGIGQLVNIHE